MMKRRTFLFASLGLGAAGTFAAPGLFAARRSDQGSNDFPAGQSHHGASVAFGTTVSVQVLHADVTQAQRAIGAALHQVRQVDALMSLYRPDNQIATLNRVGQLHRPNSHVLVVLNEAQRLARLTDGAFDVTVQPLWSLHAEAARQGSIPSGSQVNAATRLVDWRRVIVEDEYIRFTKPGMALTFNGIAQGYASDLALAALKAHGISHALLDTGEFSSLGRAASGRPWTLGIRDPRNADSLAATLALDGRSMATSGDYEMRFGEDDSRHHILDPKTGYSPVELTSVSVLAPSGMLADGLSTACFVLGPQRALALCRQLHNVDAVLIEKSGRVYKTPGIAAPEKKSSRG